MSKRGNVANLRLNPRLPLGHIKIASRCHGKPRAWVKVDHREGRSIFRLRAHVVFEEHFGPIPEGSVVHHRDRDTLNDDPANLEAMTPKSHLEEHRQEVNAARRPRRKMRQERLSRDLAAAFGNPVFSHGPWNP